MFGMVKTPGPITVCCNSFKGRCLLRILLRLPYNHDNSLVTMLRTPLNRALPTVTRRALSSQASSSLPSSAYTDPTKRGGPSTSSSPNDITKEQKHALDSALRVDQAGEVAANYIYKGQLAVLGRHRTAGPNRSFTRGE